LELDVLLHRRTSLTRTATEQVVWYVGAVVAGTRGGGNRENAMMTRIFGRKRASAAMPGLGLSLGITLTWLSLIALIPLCALVFRAGSLGAQGWLDAVSGERVWLSLRLSFGASLAAAALDTVAGLLIAWVLCRYKLPFHAFWDVLVDLPFALPTAVAGIALTALWEPHGWLGQLFVPLGGRVAFAAPGVVVALTFIGLPFVVRTVQPVLQSAEKELEEAAESLGASPAQIAWRVVLPSLRPALLTGFALAFARAVGEYGSVIFICGNIPMKTEITPLLIVARLEQYDYAGATALATIMLALSAVILVTLQVLQSDRKLALR
jgi:sulfate transport system permease protein